MDVIGEKYIKLIKLSFRKIYIGGVEIFMFRFLCIYWGNLDCYVWYVGFFF